MNPLRYFDPLKWIDDAVQLAKHGGGVLLTFQTDSSWAPVDVERLLRRYGVKVFARVYQDDEGHAGLHVRHAQAKFADGLLRGHGVNVTSPQLSKPVRPSRDWGAPTRGQGLGGLVVDAMDGGLPGRRRERRQRRERRNARR